MVVNHRNPNVPLRPIYGEAKLYYRHAEGENLFLVGSEDNRHKVTWFKEQIEMFSRLGWRFVVIDMSEQSTMGYPNMIGERWTSRERDFLLNVTPPVRVRTARFRDLLDTLEEINLIKSTTPSMKHVTVVNLGELRALVQEEKDALYEALLKLSTYHHGVWLSAERFQPFPLERLELFHTQIVFAEESEQDIEFQKWEKKFRIEHETHEDDVGLSDEEAYCLFRGKSEGAGQVYICNLSNRGEW
jgi:hypothetical protein